MLILKAIDLIYLVRLMIQSQFCITLGIDSEETNQRWISNKSYLLGLDPDKKSFDRPRSSLAYDPSVPVSPVQKRAIDIGGADLCLGLGAEKCQRLSL